MEVLTKRERSKDKTEAGQPLEKGKADYFIGVNVIRREKRYGVSVPIENENYALRDGWPLEKNSHSQKSGRTLGM